MSLKLIDSVCLWVLIWYASVMTLYKLQSVSLISLQGCYVRHWHNEEDAQAIRSWNPVSHSSFLCSVHLSPLSCPNTVGSSLDLFFFPLFIFPLPSASLDRSTCVFSTMRWPIPMNASATSWLCMMVAGVTCWIFHLNKSYRGSKTPYLIFRLFIS